MLGERATVEWPQRRFFAFARPDEAASIGSVEISSPTQIQKRCAGEILGPNHTPTRRGRVLPAQPVDPQPVDLRPTVTARDPSKFYSPLCSSSSPATDKRPSPALVPNVG
jgi:hypothetical protein